MKKLFTINSRKPNLNLSRSVPLLPVGSLGAKRRQLEMQGQDR